jgi:2-polyprenyl-3-methyl-5-hydroxy-6-metoxy-1,4-benzoquinol methylase
MQPVSSYVPTIIEEISATNPLQKKFLDNAITQLSADEINDLNTYLSFCVASGITLPYLADCYLTIVKDTLSEQTYFMEHEAYRYNRFADVGDNVYFNDAYMKKYMYGLAITAFLWPNHTALHRFFLENIPTNKKGKYLEIGPGHGYYFMNAMARSAYDNFTGVDISKTSLDLTKNIIHHYYPDASSRVSLVEADFLNWQDHNGPYDAITMGEVLEHVENPLDFLKKIASLSTPATHVFLTTCVNAPAIDHIYLFRTPQEVETMMEAAGFSVVKKHYAPYVGKTLEYCAKYKLAINVAYVVKKRS